MASIATIRTGLQTALATISGLRASDNVDPSPNPPVAMVSAPKIAYDETFGDEATYLFTVIVVVSRATDDRGQQKLDTYLEPTGATSVPAAIHADHTLGGIVDSVQVKTGTPGIAEWSGVDYYQAEFEVEVFG